MNVKTKNAILKFFGVQPDNLKRRLIISAIIIFSAGILTFYIIFYSFWFLILLLASSCTFPLSLTPDLVSTLFTVPLLMMGSFITLIIATMYYLNPFMVRK